MIIGLQKSQKMRNQIFLSHLDGLQNVGARTEQAHSIKYGTWFYKKIEKKSKILVKIEDFKHQWQHSAG